MPAPGSAVMAAASQRCHGYRGRRTCTADGWDEFPSTPALYEVIVADDAEPAHASS